MSLLKNWFSLQKYLLVFLSILFTNPSDLNGLTLIQELMQHGTKAAFFCDKSFIADRGSTLKKLKKISNAIKNSYAKSGNFPVSILDQEGKLLDLILKYKQLGDPLAPRLLNVYFVSGVLIEYFRQSSSVINLNFFSSSNEILDGKFSSFAEIKFSMSLDIYSKIKNDAVWENKEFQTIIEYVFFAILPDVPAEYTLPERPGDSSDFSDDDSVGHDRSPSRSPQISPSDSPTESVLKNLRTINTLSATLSELQNSTPSSSFRSRSPQTSSSVSPTPAPSWSLKSNLMDPVMRWLGYQPIDEKR